MNRISQITIRSPDPFVLHQKLYLRPGELFQFLKYLSHKQEDLHSDSSDSNSSHVCNPSTGVGVWEQEESCFWTANLVKLGRDFVLNRVESR